ncbi:MAG TPA: Gfo/Idh/MocA family oxidoreductase, partial [Candidatus Methylomirabilis sp.]|nr:Gfo/Idh/MocA family oxidoreductase [Candidatus Methylomirabilis sp.]
DYREMLDRQKDIDGLVIATPDHTHAVITMAAIRAGKHVYCQKPLTHDVYEARMLTSERPKEVMAVPAGLNWDTWIGPAPTRPHHRAYHPSTWRCWWDFGCGMMGDRGVHTLDSVVTALKLNAPSSIDATCCGSTREVHPLAALVTFQFPARGCLPAVKVNWYEGMQPPRPLDLEDGARLPAEGGRDLPWNEGHPRDGSHRHGPAPAHPGGKEERDETPRAYAPG